ncbi:thioredoxin family protein [Fontimonas sp. SYSU GA230001]|uniref:thioredoxin family protein n=1 Tax=Fontimonas sp. SYSU GA230001 TaxID=3142450 RepID=UPI0032B52884
MTKIQILGSGCAKCQQLTRNAEAAATALGLDYQIEKVTAVDDIVAYGVMRTPALAVDGQLKAAGRVLSADEIKPLLQS